MSVLNLSVIFHKLVVNPIEDFSSLSIGEFPPGGLVMVEDEPFGHSKMEAEDGFASVRVTVDEGMMVTRSSVRHHPQSLPELSLLGREALDDLSEGGEDRGTGCGDTDDVVDGVREGSLLKAAVNMPPSPADLGTALRPVVRDSEYVPVGRLGMVVEGRLNVSKPPTYSEVNFRCNMLLVSDDQNSLFHHISLD